MVEYLCPSCEGGFPASLGTDDACPWCGEPMDGVTPDVSTHPIGRRDAEELFDSETIADKLDERVGDPT